MPWNASNVPDSVKNKSLHLRTLFSKVANAALDKEQTEEEAVFAGLAAARNEENKNKPKAIKKEANKLPAHIQAVLDARKNALERPISDLNAQGNTHVAKATENASTVVLEPSRELVDAEFNTKGQLVLKFDNGERIVTDESAIKEYIENHVVVTGNQGRQFQAMNEPTGFEDRVSSELDFDVSTRTFAVSAVEQYFTVWLKGFEYTKQSDSVVLPNVTAEYFIYYDATDAVLKQTVVANESLFRNNALVGIIYWRADTQEYVYFADERHGITMDGATHAHLHLSLGAQYRKGLALTNITKDASGSLDSHSTFACTDGAIADEDITIDIVNNLPQQLSSVAQLPVYYRVGSGANWYRKLPDNFPLIQPGDVSAYVGTTRVAYNHESAGFWLLDEVPNNQYVLIHVLATNDVEYPVVAVCGNTYQTKADAREGANTELANITGLPFAEFVRLGTVIYQSANSYSNTTKTRIVSTSEGANYIDYRRLTTYTPLNSGATGAPAEIPANVVRGYYTEVSTSAYTPLVINHNLGLINRNSFTIGATYLNQSVQIEVESIDGSSIRIETAIDVPLLSITITGMVAV
jgi:uncharacterized protein YdaT